MDYSELADDVTVLLSEMGATMTLQRVTRTGSLGEKSESVVPHSILGVRLSERVMDAGGNYTGTRRAYVLISAEAPVTPQKGDRVIVPGDAEPREVTEVHTLAPAGVTVYWRLDLAYG